MKGVRRVPKPSTERRFPDRRDEVHLDHVRQLACLIRGKRGRLLVWRGVHPNRREEWQDVTHFCDGPSQAHHAVSKARGGHDRDCAPLCPSAHRLLHDKGRIWFAQTFGVDPVAESKRLAER
jgi:hypothetical protein